MGMWYAKTGLLGLLIIACVLFAGCALFDGKDSHGPGYDPPETGDKAPEFWLKNQDQARVSLSDFSGRKNVILVFFPLAFTPV